MALVLNSSSISGIGSGGLYAPGHVMQVLTQSNSTATSTTSNASWTDVGFSLSITPLTTTSKILITAYLQLGNRTGGLGGNARILRNGSSIYQQNEVSQFPGFSGTYPDANGMGGCYAFSYLDSPSSTSTQTYTIQIILRTGNGGTFYINDLAGGSQQPTSLLTVMEIAQ